MRGETVVCIASGVSLTAEDCGIIEATPFATIAVNNSWQRARFCKVIYAGDHKWWHEYHESIDIPAERWSCARHADRYGCRYHPAGTGDYNSGMRAIQFAIWRGAKQIILLGYDCSIKQGTHWHGNHVGLKNPDNIRVKEWHKQFAQVAKEAEKATVDIINCSRYTDLTCFRQKPLEEILNLNVPKKGERNVYT